MGFTVHSSSWDSLPYNLAERVFGLLPPTDLQTLRLVNHYWRHATNVFVKQQRPVTLRQLFSLKSHYPKLTSVDISTIEISNESQLRLASTPLSHLHHLEQVSIRAAPDLTLESLARAVPYLNRLTILPGTRTGFQQSCGSSESFPLTSLRLDLFKNLAFLDLSWNPLHEDLLIQLGQLSGLQSLNLKNCLGVDDALVEDLASKGTIRSLNLSNTSITDEGLMTMNDLPLESLNISRCGSITDDGMFWLQYIRSLQELDISGCSEISSGGIEQLRLLPKLKRLYLQEMKVMRCCSLREMFSLEVLNLRDCFWVNDAVLSDLSLCRNLRFLNLRNCSNFTDLGLRNLLELKELESVNLRGCCQITDFGVTLLSDLIGLKDLDLSFLNQVTDRGLASLMKIKQLSRLVLNWCNQITANGLQKLKENCRELQELSIKGCHNLGSADLVLMNSSIKKLDFEHSLCTVSPADKKQELEFPMLQHIDSIGCFIGIC